VIAGQWLKYALISGRTASLYLRWHNGPISHPRRGLRADVSSPMPVAVLSGTLFVMRIICPRRSASSNLWKASVMVGTDAKPLRYRVRHLTDCLFCELSDAWY